MAPGPLALVQAFINTHDRQTGQDDLSTPEHLRAWLIAHGLLLQDAVLDEVDLRTAMVVREAFHHLVSTNNGALLDARYGDTLDRVADDARLTVRFGADGAARLRSDARGINGALGRLLALALGSMADGTWERLKTCRNDSCAWVFYDASKNRSGVWCAMEICGSRTKASAYRRRRREEHPAPG